MAFKKIPRYRYKDMFPKKLETLPKTWNSKPVGSRLWLEVGEGPVRMKVKTVSKKEINWLKIQV